MGDDSNKCLTAPANTSASSQMRLSLPSMVLEADRYGLSLRRCMVSAVMKYSGMISAVDTINVIDTNTIYD